MIEFLPPRSTREITLDGYAVPDIEAREVDNGTNCNIFVDGRFGITIPAEHAQQVLWLLANAMAVGAGYSCHGENSVYRPNPYKVRVACIGTVKDADGTDRPVGDGS